jgi:hypothetical protein
MYVASCHVTSCRLLQVERGASVKLSGIALSVLDASFSDHSSHCVQVVFAAQKKP